MKHPSNRCERRFAREVWRDRRRRVMMTWYQYSSGRQNPAENRIWWYSGKQCVAHGNRCACTNQLGRHQEVKRLRREKFLWAGCWGTEIPCKNFGVDFDYLTVHQFLKSGLNARSCLE